MNKYEKEKVALLGQIFHGYAPNSRDNKKPTDNSRKDQLTTNQYSEYNHYVLNCRC